MITTPTVFVLGAGASMPYGFPSGATLRFNICNATRTGSRIFELLRRMNINESDIHRFTTAFRDSSVASIDSFLARRPEFIEIGKLAIAASLTEKEEQDALFNDLNDDHWYHILWNALIADVKGIDDLQRNRITFMTFNYDRSLECFLHTATVNTFGVDDARAKAAWRSLEIIHVYGQLGTFDVVDSRGARPYTSDVSGERLSIGASGIKIMAEHREDSHVFLGVDNILASAMQICFLGFGFDPLNVGRLDLASVLAWKKKQRERPPTIYASTFQRTKAEIQTIRDTLCPDDTFQPINARNVMTLRESGVI